MCAPHACGLLQADAVREVFYGGLAAATETVIYGGPPAYARVVPAHIELRGRLLPCVQCPCYINNTDVGRPVSVHGADMLTAVRCPLPPELLTRSGTVAVSLGNRDYRRAAFVTPAPAASSTL